MKTRSAFFFWLHFLLVLLAWAGPFLFNWKLILAAYGVVLLQFFFFKKCFMNAGHDLTDDDDTTFYSHLFEKIGWNIPRGPLKFFVRNLLYPLLGAVAVIWQLVLKHPPLLF
mgnify:CR=1 FL=1